MRATPYSMLRPHIICCDRMLYAAAESHMRRPHITCGYRMLYAAVSYNDICGFRIQFPEEGAAYFSYARVRERLDLIAQEGDLHAYLTAPIHVHQLHCAPPCSQLYSSTWH